MWNALLMFLFTWGSWSVTRAGAAHRQVKITCHARDHHYELTIGQCWGTINAAPGRHSAYAPRFCVSFCIYSCVFQSGSFESTSAFMCVCFYVVMLIRYVLSGILFFSKLTEQPSHNLSPHLLWRICSMTHIKSQLRMCCCAQLFSQWLYFTGG